MLNSTLIYSHSWHKQHYYYYMTNCSIFFFTYMDALSLSIYKIYIWMCFKFQYMGEGRVSACFLRPWLCIGERSYLLLPAMLETEFIQGWLALLLFARICLYVCLSSSELPTISSPLHHQLHNVMLYGFKISPVSQHINGTRQVTRPHTSMMERVARAKGNCIAHPCKVSRN